MNQIPILFYGDSPDLPSGLSRIGRDLAALLSTRPEFRVGYYGRGGHGTRQAPFMQYSFCERDQWGEMDLERVWRDFAGRTRGVIFTIWDASRLFWFTNPALMPGKLKDFLNSDAFLRWGYFPIDSTGPRDRLTATSCATIAKFDRALAYTAWGAGVIERSIGKRVDWIPHGMNLKVWQERDGAGVRTGAGIPKDAILIGCVMTNQPRKDWGLAFATIAELHQRGIKAYLWAHVDTLVKSYGWNIDALIADYGLKDYVKVTLSGSMDDFELSHWYSACDLTMLPSLGEGFGFPIVESLACGRPVIHGKYGGGVELIPDSGCLVEPRAFRIETINNCVRPVYEPSDFADTSESEIERSAGKNRIELRLYVEHLDWAKLWPSCWEKWFLEGIC